MNYNKVFDIAYSETMSESLKEDLLISIAEKADESFLMESISESNSEVASLVAFVDILTSSNISEEALEDILDKAFGNMSEELVEAVTEEYRKGIAQSIIAEAQAIGLAGIMRAAKEKERAEGMAKARASLSQAIDAEARQREAQQKAEAAQKRKEAFKAGVTKARTGAGSLISKAGRAISDVGGKIERGEKLFTPKAKPEVKQESKPEAEKKPSLWDRAKGALSRLKDSAKKVLAGNKGIKDTANSNKPYMKKDFKGGSSDIETKLKQYDANLKKATETKATEEPEKQEAKEEPTKKTPKKEPVKSTTKGKGKPSKNQSTGDEQLSLLDQEELAKQPVKRRGRPKKVAQ